MLAFGGGDQLNHFFGAAEPFLDAVSIGAESLGGESGSHARVGKAGVFGDEANFVDADAGMGAMGEMDGEAIGEGSRLRAGFHEALHQIREFFAFNTGEETDAGHPGSVEEISETAFGGAGFQGDAIEQELRTRGAEEQATWPGGVDGCPQFRPCGLELASGAGMF
jgi:hypothetical protein